MNKKDLLNKIDELKLLVLCGEFSGKTDVEQFDEWVDELLGRHKYDSPDCFFVNTKYAEYRALVALVQNLFDEKFNSFEYQKDRQKNKRLVSEVIAMYMFIKEKTKSL